MIGARRALPGKMANDIGIVIENPNQRAKIGSEDRKQVLWNHSFIVRASKA